MQKLICAKVAIGFKKSLSSANMLKGQTKQHKSNEAHQIIPKNKIGNYTIYAINSILKLQEKPKKNYQSA